MLPLPHQYQAKAKSKGSYVEVSSLGLPSIETSAPADFGGPEDFWSPETLFVGAISDCFILTFKAIARATKLDWVDVQCDVDGTLDKLGKGMEFTHFKISGKVILGPDQSEETALKLLKSSESSCLITRSLKAEIAFEIAFESAVVTCLD
jgi:organic hydroperoxide reductase OsmC/OhrA